MNIFFLDRDPQTAARYHNDKHVVKMIVETAQLMSTALVIAGVDREGLYKRTHHNHPSAVWIRKSRLHYRWTCDLLFHLGEEYKHRYGGKHRTIEIVLPILQEYRDAMPDSPWEEPPLCMPELYKLGDPVESYREYYYHDKWLMSRYTKREFPAWLIEEEEPEGAPK